LHPKRPFDPRSFEFDASHLGLELGLELGLQPILELISEERGLHWLRDGFVMAA